MEMGLRVEFIRWLNGIYLEFLSWIGTLLKDVLGACFVSIMTVNRITQRCLQINCWYWEYSIFLDFRDIVVLGIKSFVFREL